MRGMVSAAVGLWILGVSTSLGALETGTHRLVNERAAVLSNLPGALATLGFREGVNAVITGESGDRRSIRAWIGEGGVREDDGSLLWGSARYLRHFHDPLRPWGEAGLELPLLGRYHSSVRWMQLSGQDRQTSVRGSWAWGDIRRAYREALTGETPAGREAAWARVFRGLGQLMHLVVDASVPEHVRNDPHPLGFLYGSYEYWVAGEHGDPGSEEERAFVGRYLAQPLVPDPALLQEATGDAEAPVAVARVIDADRYTGQDPSVTVGAGLGVLLGLAAGGSVGAVEKWGPFRGQLVDAETGQGLAGAAILVVWWREVPNPVHPTQEFYEAREAVTDAEGRFEVPRLSPPVFSAFIRPGQVIYFAPGYRPLREVVTPPDGQPFVAPTVVEMRRLKTREELLAKRRSRPALVPPERMRHLIRAVNVERAMLGLGPVEE